MDEYSSSGDVLGLKDLRSNLLSAVPSSGEVGHVSLVLRDSIYLSQRNN